MNNEIREITTGVDVPLEKPAVSIIIPNYNTAQYIAETLDSVFAQTFTDYEIIVVDDGAPDTDDLKAALEPYLDRIIFIEKSENSGTSTTRNLAAGHARADILAFLDADDIWQPAFLEDVLTFKRAGQYDMAYADAETFGVRHAVASDFLAVNPSQGDITRSLLVGGKCHILPSGSLIDASAFRMVGGFDPRLRYVIDWEMWIRIAAASIVIYIPEPLASYRVHPGAETHRLRGAGEIVPDLIKGMRQIRRTLLRAGRPDCMAVAMEYAWDFCAITADEAQRLGKYQYALRDLQSSIFHFGYYAGVRKIVSRLRWYFSLWPPCAP